MLTLNDGRSELWQWDTKRKLTVDADCTQVHFSNKVFGRSIDADVVDGVAVIPDILLQTDKDLTAWAFVGSVENGYTKISKVFKVNKRNKPADYVFTPTDQTTLGEILKRVEDLEKRPSGDVSKEDIQDAVSDYLDKNPVSVVEKDPTVPDWAKQPQKPTYTAKEVGAQPEGDYALRNELPKIPNALPNPNKLIFTGSISAEYDGSSPVNVEIPESGGSANAVLYTEQELTPEQQEQARKNIGAMPADAVISLTTEQVNALDALFKVATYSEDASAVYAAFRDAFGLDNPDEPSEDVVVSCIKKGSVTFEYGAMLLSVGWDARATLVPVGQYLKKGKTYRFSLGSLNDTYYYGVQIMVAKSAGMVFPYVDAGATYNSVTARIVDTGYMTDDYIYECDTDNCIVGVNFKKNGDASMSDSNYAEILENFVVEML